MTLMGLYGLWHCAVLLAAHPSLDSIDSLLGLSGIVLHLATVSPSALLAIPGLLLVLLDIFYPPMWIPCTTTISYMSLFGMSLLSSDPLLLLCSFASLGHSVYCTLDTFATDTMTQKTLPLNGILHL
jgi:hypothetical protein